MKKTKKIGTINEAIKATLFDNKNNVIGYSIDTPNCIAFAMAKYKNIAFAISHYSLFGDNKTTREQLSDRFDWVINDSDIHEKNIIIL